MRYKTNKILTDDLFRSTIAKTLEEYRKFLFYSILLLFNEFVIFQCIQQHDQ